jgi:hypothetical protein
MSGEALPPQSRRGSLHFILGRLGLDRALGSRTMAPGEAATGIIVEKRVNSCPRLRIC